MNPILYKIAASNYRDYGLGALLSKALAKKLNWKWLSDSVAKNPKLYNVLAPLVTVGGITAVGNTVLDLFSTKEQRKRRNMLLSWGLPMGIGLGLWHGASKAISPDTKAIGAYLLDKGGPVDDPKSPVGSKVKWVKDLSTQTDVPEERLARMLDKPSVKAAYNRWKAGDSTWDQLKGLREVIRDWRDPALQQYKGRLETNQALINTADWGMRNSKEVRELYEDLSKIDRTKPLGSQYDAIMNKHAPTIAALKAQTDKDPLSTQGLREMLNIKNPPPLAIPKSPEEILGNATKLYNLNNAYIGAYNKGEAQGGKNLNGSMVQAGADTLRDFMWFPDFARKHGMSQDDLTNSLTNDPAGTLAQLTGERNQSKFFGLPDPANTPAQLNKVLGEVTSDQHGKNFVAMMTTQPGEQLKKSIGTLAGKSDTNNKINAGLDFLENAQTLRKDPAFKERSQWNAPAWDKYVTQQLPPHLQRAKRIVENPVVQQGGKIVDKGIEALDWLTRQQLELSRKSQLIPEPGQWVAPGIRRWF